MLKMENLQRQMDTWTNGKMETRFSIFPFFQLTLYFCQFDPFAVRYGFISSTQGRRVRVVITHIRICFGF